MKTYFYSADAIVLCWESECYPSWTGKN